MADHTSQQIERTSDQIAYLRCVLGDWNTVAHMIQRPKYMTTNRFDSRIKRLIKHEAKLAEMLLIYTSS
jgi:hypothetical protein